jgi:RNA polymerase sigma-B factor
MTQTQVAARVGISQMHVSRLIRRSIERLREYMVEEENPAPGALEEDED